jgi:hypothetical protein
VRSLQAIDILDGKAVQLASERTSATAGIATRRSAKGGLPFVAQQSMIQPWRQGPTAKPAGSRIILEASTDSIVMESPKDGLSGSTLSTGAFAVAWNSFVAFWTVGALTGGGVLFALFSIPFWFAGGSLVRQTLLGALLQETVRLDSKGWSVRQELAQLSGGAARFVGGNLSARSGDVSDVAGAKVCSERALPCPFSKVCCCCSPQAGTMCSVIGGRSTSVPMFRMDNPKMQQLCCSHQATCNLMGTHRLANSSQHTSL